MGDWRDNLLEDEARIFELVRSSRRVAVLGMKTEEQADQAAFYVPRTLAEHGAEVIPVPVHFPEASRILGATVYRRVSEVPGPVDIVDVFRRAARIPEHVEDILAKRPRAVWFQLGIRNDRAAGELARSGILVVQDRCLMVDWRRHAR